MSEQTHWTVRYESQIRTLSWLLGIAALIFIVRQTAPMLSWIMGAISPFLVALIVAYIIFPIVQFAQSKLRLGRIGGILIVALVIVLIISGLTAWLVPVLYQQASSSLTALRLTSVELM